MPTRLSRTLGTHPLYTKSHHRSCLCRTAIGLRVKDGIVIAVEKLVHSKLLVPGANRRIQTVDRHVGLVRTLWLSMALLTELYIGNCWSPSGWPTHWKSRAGRIFRLSRNLSRIPATQGTITRSMPCSQFLPSLRPWQIDWDCMSRHIRSTLPFVRLESAPSSAL